MTKRAVEAKAHPTRAVSTGHPDTKHVSALTPHHADGFHDATTGKPHTVSPPPSEHKTPESPRSWAKAEHGWTDKSHKDKSLLGEAGAKLQRMGATLRSWWNSMNQLFSRGESSTAFFSRRDATKKELLADRAIRTGGVAPSATVEKLLDNRGPRSGRLTPTDLTNVTRSMLRDRTDIHLIDGYSMAYGSDFRELSGRKPSERLRDATQKTMMPFTFPSNGFGAEAHIVLITADPTLREIRYFDPKGLPSDAPPRLGGFNDKTFNLRADLEELARHKGEGWKIRENTVSYQRDPTNCGTFVALAVRDEVAGRRVGDGWKPGEDWVNKQKHVLAADMWTYLEETLT